MLSAPNKPKTKETKFEKNIIEVTGKANKNDAINSIISIQELDLDGLPMQYVEHGVHQRFISTKF